MQLKYLFAFIFLFTAFIFTDFSAQNLSNTTFSNEEIEKKIDGWIEKNKETFKSWRFDELEKFLKYGQEQKKIRSAQAENIQKAITKVKSF